MPSLWRLLFLLLWGAKLVTTYQVNTLEKDEDGLNSCDDISGYWRNSKGSVLKIDQDGHVLHGTFTTAVEVSKGSAGNGARHIRGFASDGIFSFAVKYRDSMSAFTGQCFSTNGKETLFVTWILHGRQTDCNDYWMATRTGQDKFERTKSPFVARTTTDKT